MGLINLVKDHIFIGGPNAVSGWGLLTLLAFQGGFNAGVFRSNANPVLFLAVVVAAFVTGNGVYALNAYYDIKVDKINKPSRPLPSGRMMPQHALKYAYSLMALGLAIAGIVSLVSMNPTMFGLWIIFTLLGLAYSIPPVKLKSRHLFGNLCFGLFAGFSLAVMYVIYQPIALDSGWWLTVIFTSIFVAGFITMKDFYDVEGDVANGDSTLAVKFGRKGAAIISIFLIGVFLLGIYVASSPKDITSWLMTGYQFTALIIMGAFIVYLITDSVGRDHLVSNSYAKVIYYYVILTSAYGFVKGALLPWKNYSFIQEFVTTASWNPLAPLDRFVMLVVFVLLTSWVLFKSRKLVSLKPSATPLTQ